jgi:HlyD family secretion protein
MTINLGFKAHPPQLVAVLGSGLMLIGGGGVYWWWMRHPQPLPQVTAVPVINTVSALGRLEPVGEVIQVFAPTSMDGAKVETLYIKHGQQIKKGAVIAVLDTYARRKAALQEAQRQVEVAQSRLTQTQAGAKTGDIQAQREKVNQIQAEFATERASQQAVIARIVAERDTEVMAQTATIARLNAEVKNAALEDRRYQALFLEGAVSESVRDRNRLTWDTTRQQLAEAKANLARIQRSRQQQIQEAQVNLERIVSSRQTQLAGARATLEAIAEVRPVDVEVVRSQVAQAKANRARAQADLDLAVVRSPQAGQVLKLHTQPGELVGNQGIISLGQTQRMVAVAEVYESDLSRVRVGQSATVTSKNAAFAEELHGKVSEVGLEINKQDVLNTDPAAQFDARVVEVKVLLDEPSSKRVAGLTNLSIQAAIHIQS